MSRNVSSTLMLFVLVLAVSQSLTFAFDCPAIFCDDHFKKCPELDMECQVDEAKRNATHYLLDPKGGFCGCCPACIRLLQENDPCPFFHVPDVTESERCDSGLECDETSHKCVRKSNSTTTATTKK